MTERGEVEQRLWHNNQIVWFKKESRFGNRFALTISNACVARPLQRSRTRLDGFIDVNPNAKSRKEKCPCVFQNRGLTRRVIKQVTFESEYCL